METSNDHHKVKSESHAANNGTGTIDNSSSQYETKSESASMGSSGDNLDNELSKPVFDHLRNYLMCSFLLAIGISEVKQQSGLFFGLVSPAFAGVVTIALSCALFSLNLYDGIRRISQYKYRSIYTAGLIFAYMIISIGIIEIAVSFRASM